jgi:uncharacterized protein with GYD domain
MAHYLLQVGYTPDAWATLAKNPQNRAEAVRPVVESLGGKLNDFYFCFGEYDLIALCEFPDNASAGAFAVAATAGGALRAIKTTPLLTVDEGLEVMRRAGSLSYEPPG